MNKIVTVFGGTGAQGGGVVKALLEQGDWVVRVVTRNAGSKKAIELVSQGCEIVEADLGQPETLEAAFEGAYGAFVVTNFWDPGTGPSEFEQGKNAVQAAKAAGVQHFVWSTLPDYQALSGGKYQAHHFSGKARIDQEVKEAGFSSSTFVEAPLYFQNLLGVMKPKLQDDGTELWRFPMSKDKRCFHCGDITELGKIVAAALVSPEQAGDGQYFALGSDFVSWQDLMDILNGQGHNMAYQQVENDRYDSLYPGAEEFREMMNFWEDYDYYGPGGEERVQQANNLVKGGFTSFAEWAKEHLPVR